jgi:transcription elongation factor Elf1
MPVFAVKDCLSEVIGLKNDIVNKVFTCPECKTDVTISRYQVEGDLAVMCTRCNCRYQIRGEQVVDENVAGREHYFEKHVNGKIQQLNEGYKVYMRLDATQKVTAPPKDSFINVMKPPVAKPVVAAPPRPAGAPAAPGAPTAAAAPKPATPAPAPAPKAEGPSASSGQGPEA